MPNSAEKDEFRGKKTNSTVKFRGSNSAAKTQIPRKTVGPIDHLHWLSLIARIQLKVLTLIYRSHIGQAPRYLPDLIRLSSSAISLCLLRSLDRHDPFVPRARTSMAQLRAFAIIGPSLWNQLQEVLYKYIDTIQY